MVAFLRKLAEPEVKDVRHYLSKVVDITQGSRLPIFNRRKAIQIMKLIDGTVRDHSAAYSKLAQQRRPDLKLEIRKAQDSAREMKERQ